MMTIYGLVDPRDNLIHYVGKTNKANRRLIEHRNEHGRVNQQKTHWLDDMQAEGYQPLMTVLETCDDEQAEARELHWIASGRAQGWPLVNKAHGYETTASKIDLVVMQAIKLGVIGAAVQSLDAPRKRAILGMVAERAEKALDASYNAAEAARLHAAALENLLEKITEAAHEQAPD